MRWYCILWILLLGVHCLCKPSYSVYIYLCNKLSSARILIGSQPWSIKGQTHRWRQRSIQIWQLRDSLIQSQYLLSIATNQFALFWKCNRLRQSAISDTLGWASCATFLFLPHFDVICDLLLNRRSATWNLFVKYLLNIHRATQWLRWLPAWSDRLTEVCFSPNSSYSFWDSDDNCGWSQR